jgi:hypothetical protein
MRDLERQITDTEVAVNECQQALADAATFREPGRAQKIQTEYDQLSEKLKQLEAEYFARES